MLSGGISTTRPSRDMAIGMPQLTVTNHLEVAQAHLEAPPNNGLGDVVSTGCDP
jgi:hypothetical protein